MNDFVALRLSGRATKHPRQRQNLLIRTTIYGDTHTPIPGALPKTVRGCTARVSLKNWGGQSGGAMPHEFDGRTEGVAGRAGEEAATEAVERGECVRHEDSGKQKRALW